MVKAGHTAKTSGDIHVLARRVVWGEFFAYFVSTICYRGMMEGWKDGSNTRNHMLSLDAFCSIIGLVVKLSDNLTTTTPIPDAGVAKFCCNTNV